MNPASIADLAGRFRTRLRNGELLLGSMLRTPTVHATELFALAGFDFLVVDQEHAPFDIHALDMLALASRGAGIALLVRVADANPSRLLGVLDLGFARRDRPAHQLRERGAGDRTRLPLHEGTSRLLRFDAGGELRSPVDAGAHGSVRSLGHRDRHD